MNKYVPSSDRGSKSNCCMCGVDLMKVDFAYQIKQNHRYLHFCDKCYIKLGK